VWGDLLEGGATSRWLSTKISFGKNGISVAHLAVILPSRSWSCHDTSCRFVTFHIQLKEIRWRRSPWKPATSHEGLPNPKMFLLPRHLSQPNDNGGRMAEEEWKQEEESAGERTIPLTSLWSRSKLPGFDMTVCLNWIEGGKKMDFWMITKWLQSLRVRFNALL